MSVRRGAMAAVVLTVGLLGPQSAAVACEPGVRACPCRPPGEQAKAHAALVEAGRKLLSAKCSCDSKADCTCKKGQCKCAKCSGRHDVLESLQEEGGAQPVQDARRDASAGVLL